MHSFLIGPGVLVVFVYDGLFLIFSFLVWPLAVVFGWVRWVQNERQRTALSNLSLASHLFATLSMLIAVTAVLFSNLIGGFRFWDPSLVRIYQCGVAMSAAGLMLAIAGAWRSNPLRWAAPLAAFGSLLFWLASATTE